MAPHPSPYKSTGGFKRVANAVRYSMQGLVAALRYESAFRQELLLAAVLTPAAFWLGAKCRPNPATDWFNGLSIDRRALKLGD